MKKHKAIKHALEQKRVELQRKTEIIEYAQQPRVDPARFHPKRDLVLVELKAEKMTRGGIIIPDNVQEPILPLCLVIETGPDVKNVKKGDLVLFALGASMALDGKHFLVKEEEIAAGVDAEKLVAVVS